MLLTYINTSNVGKKNKQQFSDVRKDASLERLRSKFTVVGLRNRLTHHTSQLRVYMQKVHHGTQQSCRCLEDEERNCEWLTLLPGTVRIFCGNLLNHMTIITKVGVSCIHHMNDDAPEVDSFSRECCQALSSSCF